ncbi:fused response regulator/phosphatase [Hwanghaeella grinnelliae]|uniref:Fused response regulator/phosphatase n=1 Tax=Hwanghaeella grinnelliae TaxID=2500179 RepID=A0A437QTD4_9PROT|nr:SpoIIE family protein phosphatase [Hwanghaeella grinnelliae]RVU37771.1 fused response regulator/phosphatase [Hwanghaeella grinnelliae]
MPQASIKPPTEIDISSKSILIVDDDHITRRLIGSTLTKHGFSTLHYAEDGVEALEKIDRLSPDCVILDISMPVLDGFGVLRSVRIDRQDEDLPILVSSARTSNDDRNEMMRAGATIILSKPLDSTLLAERVQGVIERQVYLAELRSYRQRMEAELSLARTMQEDLLPSPDVLQRIGLKYGVEISEHHEMSSELGGDFWGVKEISDTTFAVYIVDFSGHGVGSALNTFRFQAVMDNIDMPNMKPSEVLADLNTKLVRDLPIDQFATMFLAYVTPCEDSVYFASAASPPPVIGLLSEPKSNALESKGFLLGALEGAAYADMHAHFKPNEYLCLYSDALIETPRLKGESIGMDDAPPFLAAAILDGGREAGPMLRKHFYPNIATPLPDDLTVVLVSRPG